MEKTENHRTVNEVKVNYDQRGLLSQRPKRIGKNPIENNLNFKDTEYYTPSSNFKESNSSQNEGNGSHDNSTDKKEQSTEFSFLVATHYNSLEKSDLQKRTHSRIFHLRNFNNWIKTILIKNSMTFLPESNHWNLKVLDMCCGKGGDLLKWTKLNTRHLICVDIAEKSLEEYKQRYSNLKQKWNRDCRNHLEKCDFIPADCTRVRLRSKYEDPSIQLDIVSCQFSFHYCFESLPQAECMLKNAAECLKVGGIFIGTIPDANEIVKKVKQSKTGIFQNEVCSIEMHCTEPYPLFGAKYMFKLEGVVNCPEFLVHFPTFQKLAMKYGFKLKNKKKFCEIFEEGKKTRLGEILLKKMDALEVYPPPKDVKLFGAENEYIHAKLNFVNKNIHHLRTLSKSEWEVISLYQTFIFEKVKGTLNSDGHCEYQF